MAKQKNYGGKLLTKNDLGGLTVKELVELHNSVAPEAVQGFKDKSTAVEKIWKLGGELTEEQKAEQAAAKAAKEAEKAEKKGGRAKTNTFNFPMVAGAELKKANRDTGMERLMLVLGRPEGASLEECMEAVGKTRGHIVGGIRWANKGLGYGIATSEDGRIRLVDHNGEPITYERRPEKPVKAEPAEGEEKPKRGKKAKAAEGEAAAPSN